MTSQVSVAHAGFILATRDTEIRRIKAQSQPGQIVVKTPSLKPFTKIGLME
jgi:hypothetical protein